eukprot:NODE_1023_length_2058_cov_0.491577.p1 type:complete len:323 gc:universal NODE_1023_length_2058_cov_0.491577:1468-500(-)
MRRKSDLPNKKPPPATPVKQTSRRIQKVINTPSRMPNRMGDTDFLDSPFFTPTRYTEFSDCSSPIKQILSIPFDYTLNQQFGNIYHISIQSRIFVVKKCEDQEIEIYQKLNGSFNLDHLCNINHNVMPTLISVPYIIMPFCTPLEQLMYAYEEMPIALIKQLTKQLFTALAYIHSLNILHGDIKPPNIMIYDAEIPSKCSQPLDANNRLFLNRLYLSDFSVSQLKPYTIMEWGDGRYYAPEVPFTTSLKADVFSAGLVVYELLENIVMPQHGDSLYGELRNNDFKFSMQDSMLITVVLNCCQKDADIRWSATQVVDFLAIEE